MSIHPINAACSGFLEGYNPTSYSTVFTSATHYIADYRGKNVPTGNQQPAAVSILLFFPSTNLFSNGDAATHGRGKISGPI